MSLRFADLFFPFLIFNDRALWTRIVSWFHIQTTVEGEAFKVLCSVPGPKDIQNFKELASDQGTHGCKVYQWNWQTSGQNNLDVQQTDKRVDLWECYAEYAMLNAIRISGNLGGKTSTFTFIFKIFILTCICYSTFLPGISFLFLLYAQHSSNLSHLKC